MSNTAQSLASTRIASLLDENSFVEIGGQVTARSTDFNMAGMETPSDGRQHQTEPKSIQDGDDIRRKGGSGGISGIYYSDGEQHYDLPQVSYGETAARVG